MTIMKPGKGWSRLVEVPVYEHTSGVRVHLFGLLRLPGKMATCPTGDQRNRLIRAIREKGGNVRRGTMVWALRELESWAGS